MTKAFRGIYSNSHRYIIASLLSELPYFPRKSKVANTIIQFFSNKRIKEHGYVIHGALIV